MPPSSKPPHKAARSQMNPYARPPSSTHSHSQEDTSTSRVKRRTGLAESADISLNTSTHDGKESPKMRKKKKKRDRSRSRSQNTTPAKDASATLGSTIVNAELVTDQAAPGNGAEDSTTYKRLMQIRASPVKPASPSPIAAAKGVNNHVASQSSSPLAAKASKSKEQMHQVKLQRQLEQRQEEAKRKEDHEKLKKQYEKVKQDAEAMEASLQQRIEELEKQVKAQQEHTETQDQSIEAHRIMKDSLKEAVGCGVCMETLDDPHILSCGHVACKTCLKQWFRTPGAYVHELFEDITDDTDLSHRSKVCHVCRAIIVRRPARIFLLRDILEPLGIANSFPSASQEQVDPWDKTFPVEPESYRIYDESDGVWRCPTCTGEIEDGQCLRCNHQFSDFEIDEEEDFNSEQDEIGSVLEGMGFGETDDNTDDEEIPNHRRLRGENALAPGVQAVLDLLDTEAEADENDDMSDSESGVADEGSEDAYGGSFIDDESLQEDDDASILEGSVVGSEVDELDQDSDARSISSGSEPARPVALDEVRQSRLRRLHMGGAPPAVRRNASNEEDESPVVRRARPRRAITVVSSGSEED